MSPVMDHLRFRGYKTTIVAMDQSLQADNGTPQISADSSPILFENEGYLRFYWCTYAQQEQPCLKPSLIVASFLLAKLRYKSNQQLLLIYFWGFFLRQKWSANHSATNHQFMRESLGFRQNPQQNPNVLRWEKNDMFFRMNCPFTTHQMNFNSNMGPRKTR